MERILYGKELAKKIMKEIEQDVLKLKVKNIVPGLAVVIVGNKSASKIYVKKKTESCEELSIYSQKYELPETISEADLIKLILELNENNKIHGILVQLPLPKHIDEAKIINAISPNKDVDAFHPVNVGKLTIGNFDFAPCTPSAIMELIKESHVNIAGKECVIVGRSNIVGKPTALLLLHQNATVTICHSKTKELKNITKRGDILIVAIGKPEFITRDFIKPGSIVIDVGINRTENKKIVGDVCFLECEKVASAITPVPGGVGPMTICMLMKNVVLACKKFSS